MPELLITAPQVVPGTGQPAICEPGYVLVTGGGVAGVGEGPPPREPDLALGSGYLVPGLIDLQLNGGFGTDLAGLDPAALGWITSLAEESRANAPEGGEMSYDYIIVGGGQQGR